MTDQPLGQPVDRYTFRFDRFYPHPVTLVWEALTRAEHLDSWLSPGSEIDARLGGQFRLSFGETAAHLTGKIETFRPFKLLVYAFDNGDRMCFELSAMRHGTRLILTHSVPPGFPDPDDTGTRGEGAPNEAAPRRPHARDLGAVRAVWRIVESIDGGRGAVRGGAGGRTRAVRVWRRPKAVDRRDLPPSAPWDSRCRHSRALGSPGHGEGSAVANLVHVGVRIDPPKFARVVGAAEALDHAPRVTVLVTRGEEVVPIG